MITALTFLYRFENKWPNQVLRFKLLTCEHELENRWDIVLAPVEVPPWDSTHPVTAFSEHWILDQEMGSRRWRVVCSWKIFGWIYTILWASPPPQPLLGIPQHLKPCLRFRLLVRFLPSWFPGAGFKRHAEYVGREVTRVDNVSFDWSKEKIVCHTRLSDDLELYLPIVSHLEIMLNHSLQNTC